MRPLGDILLAPHIDGDRITFFFGKRRGVSEAERLVQMVRVRVRVDVGRNLELEISSMGSMPAREKKRTKSWQRRGQPWRRAERSFFIGAHEGD